MGFSNVWKSCDYSPQQELSKDCTGLTVKQKEHIDADAPAFFPAINSHKKLKALSLARLQFNDNDVLKLIAKLDNRNISSLNLADNSITDVGAVALAHHQLSWVLELQRNQVSNIGAISLAKALKQTQMYALDLESNQIGDDGVIALTHALKANPPTRTSFSLRLQFNGTRDENGHFTYLITERGQKAVSDVQIDDVEIYCC